VELVAKLGGDDAAIQAALLAKVDQASELVREFPELEGYIGATYARIAGVAPDVVRAIDEQYRPESAGGPLPQSAAGGVLAAADKLDTLNVVFGLGKRPTGSRDPFGLRRAAIGLCRLAVESGVVVPRDLIAGDAREFVEERLEGLLDVPVQFVRAARASAASDLAGVARQARMLAAAESSEEFEAVYTAFDRAHRLAGRAEADAAPQLDESLLEDGAERDLASALAATTIDVDDGGLGAAAALAPHVNRYFDDVLVMAEDPAVRANRLRLLLDVRDALGRLGDFTQIQRAGERAA
jgi:glycyl-tRNA synthetase beta chain